MLRSCVCVSPSAVYVHQNYNFVAHMRGSRCVVCTVHHPICTRPVAFKVGARAKAAHTHTHNSLASALKARATNKCTVDGTRDTLQIHTQQHTYDGRYMCNARVYGVMHAVQCVCVFAVSHSSGYCTQLSLQAPLKHAALLK